MMLAGSSGTTCMHDGDALRAGLDLPEVSLIAILDADKEGFLRGKTALIQTIGRAARNVNGKVLMYADKLTEAIKGALDETNRRRAAAKVEGMSRDELEKLVIELEEEMFAAAEELRFKYAAKLRDEIKDLRRELVAAAAGAQTPALTFKAPTWG